MALECDRPHSVGKILQFLLVALGAGTDPNDEPDVDARAWPVHADGEPDGPDECVTTYGPPGTLDGQSPHDGDLWERPRWQVRVRSRTLPGGAAKANSIKVLLAGVYWRDVGVKAATGTGLTHYRVETVLPDGTVNDLGREPGTGRYLFTLNGSCTIDPNP